MPISRNTIKRLVKRHFGVSITDKGADRLAGMLEKEARKMATFAVENAKSNNRDKIVRKDIDEYVINHLE